MKATRIARSAHAVPALTVSALALVLLLAGCAPAVDTSGGLDAGPAAAADEPAAAADDPADDEAAEEAEEAEADAAPSCDNALTEAGYAQLEADGYSKRGLASAFGPVMKQLMGEHALACSWIQSGSDALLSYARLEGADAAKWQSELTGAGWTADPAAADVLVAPADYDPAGDPPKVVVADGVLYFASPSLFDAIVR